MNKCSCGLEKQLYVAFPDLRDLCGVCDFAEVQQTPPATPEELRRLEADNARAVAQYTVRREAIEAGYW